MSETTDTLPLAQSVTHAEPGDDTISLTYSDRLLRRRRLTSDGGTAFLADLPETRGLDEGDAFLLSSGARVAIRAAAESLVEIAGDLPRLAWHIGNRHTPCEIGPDSLRILDDHVLVAMLRQLGATVTPVTAPFRPEGGAYGHGRTMGHDHGHHHH
ncbi:urease accessory protein UreE [Mangrovicoccus sp. HB161399]|uniref:urease accessory protein UreE n=1 Tax=Mangrovicoccus sp. HB161399 TaxID=2720392 RepID=UPI0015561F81|nr:urease accessory protein UreE [Mangrovicoccus sp. HB161399]